MKLLSGALMLLSLLFGCATASEVQKISGESVAIDSLNKQIEKFNAETTPSSMGISPITLRVFRVVYDPKLGKVTCFDRDENAFLVLKRELDGRFKGILKAKYHELASSGPDGSHSWGHVLAEFYLEKGMF